MGNVIKAVSSDYRQLMDENDRLRKENALWKAGLVPPPLNEVEDPVPVPRDDAPWVTQYPPQPGMRNCDLIRDADVAIQCWRELAISGQIPYHRGVLTEAWTFVHWWGSPAPIAVYRSSGPVVSPPHYGQNKSQAAIYERFIGKDLMVQQEILEARHG